MKQSLLHVSLVVRDYDEAIDFFTTKLGFSVTEDTFIPEQNKRWVVISPPGSSGTNILLARASSPQQEMAVGNQTGGRVAFFLQTDDLWRDYKAMLSKGVRFRGEPRKRNLRHSRRV